MDVQTTFYVLAIIYMSVTLILMIGGAIYAVFIMRKVEKMQQNLEEKVKSVVTPSAVLGIGSLLFQNFVRLVRSKRRG